MGWLDDEDEEGGRCDPNVHEVLGRHPCERVVAVWTRVRGVVFLANTEAVLD